MNKLIPVGLGAAALVVALLLGSRFIGSPSSNVGGPAVEPTATAEPTHGLEGNDGAMPITVTIAAPLSGIRRGTVLGPRADCAVGMIAFTRSRGYWVYGDACHYTTTKPATPATTVDEFVDALANRRGGMFAEDITVDGYAGKKIILHMADDVDITTCDGGGDSLTMFGTSRTSRGRNALRARSRRCGRGRGRRGRGPHWRVLRGSPQNAVDEITRHPRIGHLRMTIRSCGSPDRRLPRSPAAIRFSGTQTRCEFEHFAMPQSLLSSRPRQIAIEPDMSTREGRMTAST